jgi:abhydrolase domain-containing protein 6
LRPAPALDHFADKERARSADIARWGDDYLGNWVDAEPVLGRIDAPTLVVWGDTDRILHPSTAPIFEKKIKDATLVIMKDCGHLPMLERPDESASHYARFLVDQRLR